jgi:hypothetical protein
MVEGSLGKGLDALIKKSSSKKKKEKTAKTKQETIIKEVPKPKQYNNSIKLNDEKIH